MTNTEFEFARQSQRPEWFGREPDWLYFYTKSFYQPSEWFGFPDRESAVEFFLCTLHEDHNGLEDYVFFDGDLYHLDQFTEESVDAADDADDYELKVDAKPIDLLDLVDICAEGGAFQFTTES